MRNFGFISLIILVLFAIGCKQKQNSLFEALNASQTGITFSNQLKPTPQFNLFSYMYYYNGAGVGAGDFNKDGLIDLFFAANQSQNKLFINKGNLKFEDVTIKTSIPDDDAWSTGVSVVDINNDGLLDIYVCRVGNYKVLKGKNQLLVCKGISKEGIPFYKDEAHEYGLDFSGFSTQAAFFDYDLDGDLDMFLLNHSVNHDGNYAPRSNFINTYDSLAGQKFYRNDLIVKNGRKQPHFTDITKQVGINGSKIGYGLGVVVSDINMDGWPDFYVGNDFHENDYLYLNQKNGTFKDEGTTQLMHTSQFSMGVDAADVTNDAMPDIISMDMLPYDPYMIRRSLAEDDYIYFNEKRKYGYHYQYARNNLQWNRGNGRFTEAGQYANVYATDWSWAALWMDFDNDGLKDLFVSNGIPKRMNDIDYVNFVTNDELQQKLRNNTLEEKDMKLVDKFPEIKIPNQFFSNKGNLSFTNLTDSISNNPTTFSNGTAYADLDNDGDLDLVVNNINDEALIYQNKSNDDKQKPFAAVQLRGDSSNINAIGAKILLFAGNQIKTYENYPVHGFLSSMQLPVHIGLSNTFIDSAFLIWPDNSFEKISLQPDTLSAYTYKKGLPQFDYSIIHQGNKHQIPVEDIAAQTKLSYQHIENQFNEFDREPLIPHMVSTEGPALAVADINHDGLEDVFIGSSKGHHPSLFLQSANRTFSELPQPQLMQDSMWEHVSAVWADVNNDTNVDLIIATGGNEYYGTDEHLLPLLYLNDGKGNLTRKEDAFAAIDVTQSVLLPFDFNKDGFVDLFIGGRTVPWNYGATPRSYLLQNDGSGKFTDVAKQYAEQLQYPGMVTDAKLVDMNKDGAQDLLLSYEWGGIDVFIHEKNKFVKKSISAENGWWSSVTAFDADGDGELDILATNFGLNTKLKPGEQQPVKLYHNDFDGNGRKEQILTYYLQNKEIPFATKMDLEKQMPVLKKKFLYAEGFAKASLADLFGADKLKNAAQLTVTNFSHTLFINKGDGTFEAKQLPWQTQLNNYRTSSILDVNNDQLPDVLLCGNYYGNHVQIGRQDGDFGTILINKGNGNFEYNSFKGFIDLKQVRRIQPIHISKQTAFILARNNASAAIIQIKN
ncbi:MAG: VCBS repeat-containing protein [Chitinophagaceae bacterium]|nr:VCBS repeat-containing protein [Chitinophagaceae bacterium]